MVIIYSASWCAPCRFAKQLLNEKGVNFNENILAAYEGGDYENLLKSILEQLPKSEFITTEQIDVALNDIIGQGKAKWQKE